MAKKHTEQEPAAKTTGKTAAKKTAGTASKPKKAASAVKKTTATKKTSAPKKSATVKKSSPAKKAVGTKAARPVVPPAGQEENVRIAAYYLWEQRGRIHGSDVEDWLEAEKRSAD